MPIMAAAARIMGKEEARDKTISPIERASHADAEREGLRAFVGVGTDDGLEDGGGELVGEGDQADLAEVEMEVAF